MRYSARKSQGIDLLQVALWSTVVVLVGVLIGLGLLWARWKFTEQFDVVIINGSVIDGSGSLAHDGIIGIRDGHIVNVRWPRFAEAKKTIDARGLFVAPGFIDVHTHIEGNVTANRSGPLAANNFVSQGITTIITGNCGRSSRSLSQFFVQLEKQGIELNIGSLVGHNTVRQIVMKLDSRSPTDAELERMEKLIEQAMHDGALGFSTGLEYEPGLSAKPAEIEALAGVAGRYRGIYTTHMRDEGNDVIDSLKEAISVGEKAHVPVQISHLKARGRSNWGLGFQLITMIKQARDSGLKIACDVYPYTASSTSLDTLISKRARQDGKLRERLRDPAEHEKIVAEIIEQMRDEGWHDFSFARVASCQFSPEYDGLTIPEIASLRVQPKSKPASSVSDTRKDSRKSEHSDETSPGKRNMSSVQSQAETICYLESRGGAQMIFEAMNEDDVATILRFPFCMLGSDSGIRTGDGRPHPRGFGSAPRLLSRFAREKKLFSLEEAIRRITSLPADTFQLTGRGLLQAGNWADIVVFDPDKVKDLATYDHPFVPAEGIAYVLINGEVTLDHGQTQSTHAGQIIRHKY